MENQLQQNKKTPIKKHSIRKWVFLSLSIVINLFIIINACLPAEASGNISNFFYNIAKSAINWISGDVSKNIPVDNVTLSYNDDYQYSHIDGYSDNEIPVGISKSLIASISPDDATNKMVNFSISDETKAKINTNGNIVYVTGKEIGKVTLTATSAIDNSKLATYSFNVVDLLAPTSFNVPTTTLSIYKDAIDYLPISVTSNPECYDINKLLITPLDTSIVSIDSGVIKANNIGVTSINVSNGSITKSFNVEVKDNSEVIYPIKGWSIQGNKELHIREESQLSINWLEGNNPTIKDLIWTSSDTYLASVDDKGMVTINHKRSSDTEIVRITATSKIDPSQSESLDISIVNYLVTEFELVVPYYGNHITDGSIQLEKTETKQIWIAFPPSTIDRRVNVSSSDNSIATVEAYDDYLYITCINEGSCRVYIDSVANPSLKHYIDVTVVPKGAINNGNGETIRTIIRKSLGHFLLFFLSGLFTLLFFKELFKDKKKWWLKYVITLGIGVIVAFTSELIQKYAPGRSGDLKDVLIDLGGFIFSLLILFLIWFFKHKKNNKKELNNKE